MKTTYLTDCRTGGGSVTNELHKSREHEDDASDTTYANDAWTNWVKMVTLNDGTLSLPSDGFSSWDKQRQSRKRKAQRIAACYSLFVAVSVVIAIGHLLHRW